MKTVKTVLAAAVLMSAPGLAMAYECNWSKEQTAQISCAPGTALDEATGTCVTVTG
ncbi:MAG: adenylosuccinate lyase [Pseudomonadota bacterium]